MIECIIFVYFTQLKLTAIVLQKSLNFILFIFLLVFFKKVVLKIVFARLLREKINFILVFEWSLI